MNRSPHPYRHSVLADVLIALGLGAVIYASILFAAEWNSTFNPSYQINLSLSALPLYALFSAMRGLGAYLLSLAFTLAVGYWAAKSRTAEKFIVPVLDVLQSIPVLGFLPGLVLGLVAIFPSSNIGLELAALVMIFTGQVWNMTFAFYASLKSVPGDLKEASAIMGLSSWTKLLHLELPFSAVNLVWNSIMSMAGGWFFLTVCEAFTLGDKQYRLPGLGAYMAVAIDKGNGRAMVFGILTMAIVIIVMDILIWRPALAWVHRYRLEETVFGGGEDQLLNFIFENSAIVRLLKAITLHRRRRSLFRMHMPRPKFNLKIALPEWLTFGRMRWPLLLMIVGGFSFGAGRLTLGLARVPLSGWLEILTDTGFTLLRVFAAVLLGTVWALPMGIWLSRSAARLRIAQPIAQLLASFPAPMLYPLVVGVLLELHVQFSFVAMFLMLLGVQWYILFNTLAGGLRISRELSDCMDLMGNSRWDRWRYLYLPSVFPSLVTGWVTAAGGAWNASIVAELVAYRGHTLETRGLGALISQSASHGDFAKLSACLVVMVVMVVLLNRFFWDRIYNISQTRFRLDF